jgi:hypothetical protein
MPPTTPEVGQLYRDGRVDWEYGYYTWTGPNYDASYEGSEDGWIDNGHRVSARTIRDLQIEVDTFLSDESN